MRKRGIIIGNYDSAAKGWTLTKWELSAAKQKTSFVDIPGGDGSWDMSTALTDGIPKYEDRTLTAVFECSEGTRLGREALIDEMINQLDGFRFDIRLPDDEHHYLTGRVHVAREYNDPAHASVSITCVCSPWRYKDTESTVHLTAGASTETVELVNNGRRVIIPTLTVEGSGAEVLLVFESSTVSLSEGTYQWPFLVLTPGSHLLTYSGSGNIVLSWREAVL